MKISLRSHWVVAASVLWAASARAQTALPSQSQSATPTAATAPAFDDALRQATTTFSGDTGLWFVPTAEIVPAGKAAFTVYRRGTNYVQGYTNVADFAGTFAIGIRNRLELFGSFIVDTRIDRDLRPYFIANATTGGFLDRYPGVKTQWTGDNLGDFSIGVKVNLLSEYSQAPAAVAIRGMIKIPTADKNIGVGTGKVDGTVDFVVSKEAAKTAEIAGYAGVEFRGQPDGFSTPSSAFRFGAGLGVPSRGPLRFTGELNGLLPSASTASITSGTLVGSDGSVSPLTVDVQKLVRTTFGLTYQARSGFFVGGGVSWNVPQDARVLANAQDNPLGDYWDWQVRIGYHPGVRHYVPPPPLPPPPPPPPPPQNRPPTVAAQCDPCTVEIGKSAAITANGQDPDGDPLTYRWSAPTGTIANPAERQTQWTAPQQPGGVPLTVTVDDGKGGTASASVNVQVVAPPKKEYAFEDVHFDFDRYSLRPEATRVLDEAVAALREDPSLRIEIEGHTCNIGTAEYNLALGERRANAVRDYLTSRGVSTDRLHTVSYGEERPKYDNAREETRRLNRRAALVVNIR